MGEGADIVQRQLEAWNRRDVEAFVDGLAPDAVVTFGAGVPEPGPFQGRLTIADGLIVRWENHTGEPEQAFSELGRLADPS
ncbi:MAG: hypothetical protein WD649_01615 [Thermoleophilaceae bacterium]